MNEAQRAKYNATKRAYYRKNKEKVQAINKRSVEKHAEARKAYVVAWKLANKDKIVASQQRRRAKVKEGDWVWLVKSQ